ncbi:uncharacterized protein B0H18DRAFT_433499 [Fomitopsis serialis]|uniref:uncharacterized protein n=1 Tax=Fomitopsis serialis TaxID=139415 RepID=UPI002007F336|nr:uncharacterized protein B0H18DRAFT_433499 [Neoantrodia serialis]KAH9924473.1 hypothetical protein B0H18DRAFT_433499 [Neoantrodia serialis]
MTSSAMSFGSVFVSLIVAFIIFGMTICQFCLYRRSFPDDVTRMKAIVYAVMMLDIAHTIVCVAMLYTYLVRWHGLETNLALLHWTAAATIFFQSSIVTIVQCSYVYRIWILSERSSKVLLIPILLTVVRIIVGYVTAVAMFTLHVWPQYRKNHVATVVLSVGFASSAANDIVITATQVYYLHRRRTGLRGTEYIIRTVMFYAINLGAMTMIFSIAVLLTFVLDQSSLLFGGLIELQSKLFANSLLININARRTLRINQPSAVDIDPPNLEDIVSAQTDLLPAGRNQASSSQRGPKYEHS